MSSLKQLIIDRNRVEEIQPGAFSQLGSLNLLSLSHNQLVYIPNMAFQVLTLNRVYKILRNGKFQIFYRDARLVGALNKMPASFAFRACRISSGFVLVTTF